MRRIDQVVHFLGRVAVGEAGAHEPSGILQAQILGDVDGLEGSLPDTEAASCERLGDRSRVDSAQVEGRGGHAPAEARLVADGLEL